MGQKLIIAPSARSDLHDIVREIARDTDCHCEERSDEAIQLDCHGALRAPRNDKGLEFKGPWYNGTSFAPPGRILELAVAASP